MNNCPSCSTLLLRHVRGAEIYWFCGHCRQEMPVLNWKKSSYLPEVVIEKLPEKLTLLEKTNVSLVHASR